ncbi:hypothetical protein [Streptomyces sp. Amel2xC10]|uniref:hypothetical protein n=1 Tax=Streptomyces sp. Amel2xC10 TaxID=1305826 RepID=UPI000A090556|nr:hypothetical protein [Streptomyces sp. Amel2xC10]SMF85865.1 CRISPR-associated endonuclease Cas1, subtype I-E/ECOLI [Streptomyces sp. Amel2xC10]
MRFPGEDTTGPAFQQLRGREGTRIRRLYTTHAQRTGVPWSRRDDKPTDAFAAGDDVDRLLSAADSALYGISHAAITGLGACPALGFVHTGDALSFVLDIAGLCKAEYTIPPAFGLAARGLASERDARTALRDAVVKGKLLPRIVADIKRLLVPEGTDLTDEDLGALWDDGDTVVSSGRNWSATDHLDIIPEPAEPDGPANGETAP